MRAPHANHPRRAFALLGAQLLICALVAGVLLGVSPRLAFAAPDAACVWLLATLLHALASLRFVDHAVAFLNLDCPKCSESFYGFPERLPRPSRRHCAHCGQEFA